MSTVISSQEWCVRGGWLQPQSYVVIAVSGILCSSGMSGILMQRWPARHDSTAIVWGRDQSINMRGRDRLAPMYHQGIWSKLHVSTHWFTRNIKFNGVWSALMMCDRRHFILWCGCDMLLELYEFVIVLWNFGAMSLSVNGWIVQTIVPNWGGFKIITF